MTHSFTYPNSLGRFQPLTILPVLFNPQISTIRYTLPSFNFSHRRFPYTIYNHSALTLAKTKYTLPSTSRPRPRTPSIDILSRRTLGEREREREREREGERERDKFLFLVGCKRPSRATKEYRRCALLYDWNFIYAPKAHARARIIVFATRDTVT